MISYIIRRIFLMIPTMVGIMTICFFISEFVPGGPIDQVRAMLEGDDMGGGSGEVSAGGQSGGGMNTAKRKAINPKDEMRLLRQYGYHTTRFQCYLRTILWFSPDSIISSKELDDQEATYFTRHGHKCIVVRLGDEYYAAVAQPEGGAEVYFDKEKQVFRDVDAGKNSYDVGSGKRLTGTGGDLEVYRVKQSPASRTTRYPLAYANNDPAHPLNLLPNALLHEALEKEGASAATNGAGVISVVNTDANRTLFTSWNPAKQQLEVRDEYTEVFLQEPWFKSLANWENWHGYFLLKFGRSIHYNKPSYELIKERLPVSMRLGLLSFFITYTGCIALGILKAVKHQTRFDTWSSVIILIGYSIPGFVLAVFLLANFSETESAFVHIFPTGRIHSLPEIYNNLSPLGKFWDNIHHMLAPAICLTIGSFAVLTMFTKNNILNENNQLYAVAARARGLSERKVLFKHILRNAFVPLVTGFPSSFLMMFFTGSLLIEKIFNLPGIGLLGYTAIMGRDYPVVMGNLFMFGVLGLFARLLTDICYVIADPRISFDASKA